MHIMLFLLIGLKILCKKLMGCLHVGMDMIVA